MKELLTLIMQNIEGFELSSTFRKGQKPFYDGIVKGLKKGWRTMYIEGPTGMGKTFIEAILASAIIGNTDIKILLLTSKITLLQQIKREFKNFVGFLKTGLFGGGFKNYHEQVTIMTYDSFRNLDEAIAQQYAVLLLDEGHKALGEKTKAKLERQKEFSILIGFTASVTYSDEKSLEEFLVNKAYSLSVVEAVHLGMLSNIKVILASVDIEISGQQKGESRGKYEERISADIIREGGNIATARLFKRVFAKRNFRGIALVLTRNQGIDLVEQFALEGVKAELIHSGMKHDEREDMFTRFKNHEFSVLVGMGIIKEGFDDPGISVAITTYPVQSTVDMTQFPGRAERIDEENPDKIPYIFNLAYKAKKQLFYTDILGGESAFQGDEEDANVLEPEIAGLTEKQLSSHSKLPEAKNTLSDEIDEELVKIQKEKRAKKLNLISEDEFKRAIAKKPESFITAVAVTERQVREVVRSYEPTEFLSYEDLKATVQAAGIRGMNEYKKLQKNYPNWPSNPWVMYSEEYSFDDFYVQRYLSYQELKAAVQAAGITEVTGYMEVQKNHPNWPSQPWKKYEKEYSLEDFFGKSK